MGMLLNKNEFTISSFAQTKGKKMASWRLEEQIVVHGVTKEEFGLCGGVLFTHF